MIFLIVFKEDFLSMTVFYTDQFNPNLTLQKDIDSLLAWTITWQMELNIDKCCSMSVTALSRLHKFSCTYHIQNTPLAAVTHFRDYYPI